MKSTVLAWRIDMICLTGDLHHMSLGTGNQKHCDITEIQVARRYLQLLEKRGVKTTFFVSGKSFLEEWRDLQPIVTHPLVELGGHNWNCFTPEIWHRVSNKLFRSYNGPLWYQRRDVRKTIEIISEKTGERIRYWRNHMYMHGRHTDRVLAENGILVCSDGVKRGSNGMERVTGELYNFPINIIPDHEHLYHAERTREWVDWWQKRYNWSDDFGSESYAIDEWTDLVLRGLEENEERGVTSNLIIHPITMYLCDDMKNFERILDFLSERETVFVSEVHARTAGRQTNPLQDQ